jgi:peptidoglycan/xylan/chitin deacetylase (PgdA/CDA1 family)
VAHTLSGRIGLLYVSRSLLETESFLLTYPKRIVIIAVSLGVFTVDWFRNSIRLLTGKKAPRVPAVLAYHSVSKQNRAAFARQMDILARCTKLWDAPVAHLANGRRTFVTFDDGFQSTVDNALPELAQRGLPATIFVVAGALGTTPGWTDYSDGSDPAMSEPIITREQLRALPSDLIEVGSHSVTHPMFSMLSERQARTELVASRQALEEITGREVKLFSFPYGSANADLVSWCREAGYEHVFITYPRAVFSEFNGLVVARVRVDPEDWLLEFHLKVRGAYRWRNRWHDYWRKLS